MAIQRKKNETNNTETIPTLQHAQTQRSDTISITNGLATALYSHLKNGGTRIEADMLAEHIVTQSQAQQAEAQRSAELEAVKAQAIEQYKASLLPEVASHKAN
jgi:hypothetical protein